MKHPNNRIGVTETNDERGCPDVNKFVGDLAEAIHYEIPEETYQVQRCLTDEDKACDTTYKIGMTKKPTQDCYNISRQTQAEVGKNDVHRYCEKLFNIFPF